MLGLSPRGEVLLRDGDAVLPLLLSHSLDAGQAQDWAFSSVLFAPELAVFRLLALALPDQLAQVLAAAVFLVLLYGAIRWASGARGRGNRSPVFGALLAFGVFCLFAVSGLSASRDAMDLASLMGSLTYYSATVVGTVFIAGCLRRLADGAPRVPMLVVLGAVTAVQLADPAQAMTAIAKLREHGVSSRAAGQGALQISPAFTMTTDEVGEMADRFTTALNEL